MTARSFNGTSDKAVFGGSIIDINTVPIGMFVRARITSLAAAAWMAGWSSSTVANRISGLLVNTAGRVYCQHGDDASVFVSSVVPLANAVLTNTWFTAAWADLSSTSHTVWANGAGETTSTSAIGTRTLNRFCVGVRESATPALYFPGQIADVSVWDLTSWGANTAARLAAFRTAQAAMSRGVPPSSFPIGRVDNWRLRGNLSPENGRNPLTLAGTSKATQGPPVARRYNGRTAA